MCVTQIIAKEAQGKLASVDKTFILDLEKEPENEVEEQAPDLSKIEIEEPVAAEDPTIEVVLRNHQMKKINPFPRRKENEFEMVDTVVSLKRIIPKEVKGDLIFPDLEFTLQEFPDFPPIENPDFYKREVFTNNVFFIIDDPNSSWARKDEIINELEHRKKRTKAGIPALEKKLGIAIMKDNVHHLVDFFEEYLITHVDCKLFKQYIV